MYTEIRKTAQGIRNPSNDWISESNLLWHRSEPSTGNLELIQDCLVFPYMARRFNAGRYLFRFRRLRYRGKQQQLFEDFKRLAILCSTKANSAWKLCWRASVDGWAARTFHSRCDGKGPTVTIIRVGRYIFGGYTSVSWGKLTWLQKDIILLLAVTSGYQLWSRSLPLFTSVETTITWNNNSNGLVPVVKKLDSAINRINHYPADKHMMVSIGLTDRRDA